MPLISRDPATGETLKEYRGDGPVEAVGKADSCHGAYLVWRETGFGERAAVLERAAEVLREGKEGYATLMAREMGKPLAEGRAEVEKCAWVCEYYAQNGEAFLSPEEVGTGAAKSYVAFRPLGVVLAIMPWNFPFWQVFRFAAPALMAGNTCLLKHASNVPGCALAIEDIFLRAGLHRGAFVTALVPGSRAGELIDHPRVRAVTLTGSTEAGKAVAARAGGLVKKTVLELGGSDPYVILEDADLARAARAGAAGRLLNAGQSCIAAKRFVAVESVREEFTRLLASAMGEAVMGDPTAEGTTMGPLAGREFRDQLHSQVTRSVEMGARVVMGGEVPNGPGAFYPPTVLTGVREGMPAYGEELFGPVASVIGAKDEDDALRMANDTSFGLGAAVFTRDMEKGERIALEALEAGSCFVNDFVRSDPRLPFGGTKESGYGRELSAFGIREFVNVKTVYVSKT